MWARFQGKFQSINITSVKKVKKISKCQYTPLSVIEGSIVLDVFMQHSFTEGRVQAELNQLQR